MIDMHDGRAAGSGNGESASHVVLVVEDDVDCLDALVDVLSYDGYRVQTACHGLDAMQKLEAGPRPDVILVDLMMPVMNGWQFREAQLADAELASMPVIVITAGRPERTIDARKILKKPFDVEELLLAIAAV